MDSRVKQETTEPPSGSGGEAQDPSQPPSSAKKSSIKKRTKTGCLTCRRRRIKCDEGKPRCNNCIKSKRQCDGYNQRVIFKDPMGTFQTNHMGAIIFQNTQPHPMLMHHQAPNAARNAAPHAPNALPFIAPRPPLMDNRPSNAPMHYQHHRHLHPLHAQHAQHAQTHGLPPHPNMLLHQGQPMHPDAMPFLAQNQHNAPLDLAPFGQPWQQQLPDVDNLNAYALDSSVPPALFDNTPGPVYGEGASIPPSDNSEPWLSNAGLATDDQITLLPHQQYADASLQETDESGAPARYSVFAEEDAYWYSDDDASMAESDDEQDSDEEAQHLQSNDLGVIVARRLHNRPLDAFGTQMRTFSNFADANVLATYVPSSTNSPLNDAQTASVFWYFVNVTGPSMSLFERRPIDPSPMFQGQPVPRSRQHIWTYTFPIIALNHPALLQAMLALGSLQMAKLQGAPHTASMKHYHLSLRRIARNYQSASRRVQPATLAATMLLGFYEVWNSDHDKWCKHMWGARAILKEVPLRDMTRKIVALKRDQRELLQAVSAETGDPQYADSIVAERDIDQVDTYLVARLSGRPVAYEDVAPPSAYASGPIPSWTTPDHYTEKDIETYELVSDVFWWYCKMDVYQSILGGTPLLMEYGYWTQCAPRAPIGKIDAIYGTYDHLMLLLGRLCDFASKDQARKRKAKKPDGAGGPQGQSPPGFVGMMPSTGHITIPKGFSPPREATPQSDSHEETDFETSTAAAMREWEAIRQTFEFFRSQLGPDFEPLGPEYEPPVNCPFGTTLKYRTYSIASIWMSYCMGLIVLHRSHPTMPPIAMAAAGMAAPQTAPYANQIGRIISGLTGEDLSTLTHVSTLLGAVSIESSFPLFVAAVQYQDTAQRHWTVRRLNDVARLTGWQSARQIANGCEIGWTKAASLGRGPPYEPPADVEEVPPSIWSRPRRIGDRIRELDDVEERLVLSSSERPHYAVGLLSVETDLEKLELRDHD